MKVGHSLTLQGNKHDLFYFIILLGFENNLVFNKNEISKIDDYFRN